MDDETVALPNHVTRRGAVYHYVRRVPDDIADAFKSRRIQRSLKTSDRLTARERGLEFDKHYERHFGDIRRARGVPELRPGTETWSSKDWQRVAEWLHAKLIYDDWQLDVAKMPGSALLSKSYRSDDVGPGSPFALTVHRLKHLQKISLAHYAESESSSLSVRLKPLGIRLTPDMPLANDIFGPLLTAEIKACEGILARRNGEIVNFAMPDSITGPWKPKASKTTAAGAFLPQPQPRGDEKSPDKASERGRTVRETAPRRPKHKLMDVHHEWVVEQQRRNRPASRHTLMDREKTIQRFRSHTGIAFIEDIERRHLIDFREHLVKLGRYEPATVNKKLSYISVLLRQALHAGHIDAAIAGQLHIPVPEGEGQRDSFNAEQLARLFGHPIFTKKADFDDAKAGDELQFWLPLISTLHGLISSEIMQLGPDTIVPHPDDASVLCFLVTNANERRIKALARQRYVPIRQEVLDLGFMKVVDAARSRGDRSLWSAVNAKNFDITACSANFSGWFSQFLRDDVGISDEKVALYSCRHSFKDALARAGVPPYTISRLMGHAEQTTTAKYGSKRTPTVINIRQLDDAIKSAEWSFLVKLKPR